MDEIFSIWALNNIQTNKSNNFTIDNTDLTIYKKNKYVIYFKVQHRRVLVSYSTLNTLRSFSFFKCKSLWKEYWISVFNIFIFLHIQSPPCVCKALYSCAWTMRTLSDWQGCRPVSIKFWNPIPTLCVFHFLNNN